MTVPGHPLGIQHSCAVCTYAPTIAPTFFTTVSESGNWSLPFLEWMSVPLIVTSKTPPLEGMNVSAVIEFLYSWSSVSAKLTALSRYPHAVQYSMETVVSFAITVLLPDEDDASCRH